MILQVREYYLARTRREQRLILLMLGIAVPLLVWLLLVRPLGAAYDRALDRHLEAIDRNGRVRALADAPLAPAPGPSVAPRQLDLLVAESASRAGLALGANSSAGAGAVGVSIPQAAPIAVMQWLRELEAAGVRIEELRMVPSGEGLVSVTARLARSGR